jgi:methionyl-tRNA formyltransferase
MATAATVDSSGAAAPEQPARAVVFAYHNVGVRCLKVLLDRGIDVALVITHDDSPTENIWFGSVRELAHDAGIPTISPLDPNTSEVVAQIGALRPDFIFSFYYRLMLGDAILAIPTKGALNMHGSLLPRYRGRVPINWAVLHGERSTGASLHYMVTKPDAGDLVAQVEVPILANDTAGEVFDKVVVAAESALWRALPGLVAGNAPRVALELSAGNYFAGRKAQDGRIDWTAGVRAVHNLVRAVAPPYPGAFFDLAGHRFVVHETRVLLDGKPLSRTAPAQPPLGGASDQPTQQPARLLIDDNRILVRKPDGDLWLRQLWCDNHPCDAAHLAGLLALPLRLTQ